MSVCLPVRLELVSTITQQGFHLETLFSHRMCIRRPSRGLYKMGSIDLDLQGHFGLKLTDFRNFDGFYAITRQGFDRESPFSHRMWILGPFITLSKMGSIDLDLQGNFLSNVYIVISQERIDRLTSDENHLDRWVTEKNWMLKIGPIEKSIIVMLLICMVYWLRAEG